MTNFDHCNTSKSRCRPLLRTCGRSISRERQAAVMKLFSSRRRLSGEHVTDFPRRSVLDSDVSSVSIKLLDIRVSGNLGTRGRLGVSVALIMSLNMYHCWSCLYTYNSAITTRNTYDRT